MQEECLSFLLNNILTTDNSREARQLQVKPICSQWVLKMKHNPDVTIRYKAHQVIEGCEQLDCGEIYAPVGILSTLRYLTSLFGQHG
jgi:hypothetical protein